MDLKRALKLTINDEYDFKRNRIVSKLTPNNTLAFGEPMWEPRARLYKSGITKMKEKEWKSILAAATNEDVSGKGCRGAPVATEEKAELSWDSDSD